MKFIDLFAGLGGFHLALEQMGHECVFASEMDEGLRSLYQKNFGVMPAGDITKLAVEDIPAHEVLCAGFPCQSFSKAGDQLGFECPRSGYLINNVIDILEFHRPQFFILENVPNIVKHNEGRTLEFIKRQIELLGYAVDEDIFSPHMFGVPQVRPRAFIVGALGSLSTFKWPEKKSCTKGLSIKSVLDKQPMDAVHLPDRFVRYLEAWQQFIDLYPKDKDLPSFPIWAMEFGATYPYEKTTPHASNYKDLLNVRGGLGRPLDGPTKEAALSGLPSYALTPQSKFPDWKIDFIRKNRELYSANKEWLDEWLPLITDFPASFQKFEWNCKGEERCLWNHVIQFRASGIRVKRQTSAPSLVAMTASQVPIVTWEKRYMTPRECSRLQSMEKLHFLPHSRTAAYKALGNAVNVRVVKEIASGLLNDLNAGQRPYKEAS